MAPDWHGLAAWSVPPLEIVLRGTLVYLFIFILLRVVVKRQVGTVALPDLLVVVLIADAAQNAMSKDYKSVPDGLLLVSTIVFWSWLLDWAGYRWPAVGRLVHPAPLELVRDGKLLRDHLRRELITREELEAQLREHGVSDLREVSRAYMEGDGKLSVVKKGGGPTRAEPRRAH